MSGSKNKSLQKAIDTVELSIERKLADQILSHPRAKKSKIPSIEKLRTYIIGSAGKNASQIYFMPISELKFLERNPNRMTPKELTDLEDSMQKFNAVEPAIVNLHELNLMRIVGGNHRIEGAIELKWVTFPCVFVDLDPDKQMELVLRLKKNQGTFDNDVLKDIDAFLLKTSGFDDSEVESVKKLYQGDEKYGFGNVEPRHEIVETQIRPFHKTHILLSFPPDRLVLMQPYLEKILEISGVEYEQSSN